MFSLSTSSICVYKCLAFARCFGLSCVCGSLQCELHPKCLLPYSISNVNVWCGKASSAFAALGLICLDSPEFLNSHKESIWLAVQPGSHEEPPGS